jgi:hypothetical protein
MPMEGRTRAVTRMVVAVARAVSLPRGYCQGSLAGDGLPGRTGARACHSGSQSPSMRPARSHCGSALERGSNPRCRRCDFKGSGWGVERRAMQSLLHPPRSPRSGSGTTNAPTARRNRDCSHVRTRTCRRAQGAPRPSTRRGACRDSRTRRRSVKSVGTLLERASALLEQKTLVSPTRVRHERAYGRGASAIEQTAHRRPLGPRPGCRRALASAGRHRDHRDTASGGARREREPPASRRGHVDDGGELPAVRGGRAQLLRERASTIEPVSLHVQQYSAAALGPTGSSC